MVFLILLKTQREDNFSYSLLPAPEHLAHIHRRFLQDLVPNVCVDVRRGLVVRVTHDLHCNQRVDTGFVPSVTQDGLQCASLKIIYATLFFCQSAIIMQLIVLRAILSFPANFWNYSKYCFQQLVNRPESHRYCSQHYVP